MSAEDVEVAGCVVVVVVAAEVLVVLLELTGVAEGALLLDVVVSSTV